MDSKTKTNKDIINDIQNYKLEVTNSENQFQDLFGPKNSLLNVKTRFELSPRRDKMEPKDTMKIPIKKKKSNSLLINYPKSNLLNDIFDEDMMEKIDNKITNYIRERKDIDEIFNDPEIKRLLPPDYVDK
jgi:hypothetical protein